MRSKKELTSLFTTYFSDKISPSEIDTLVVDVMTGVQNRSARTQAAPPALAASPGWATYATRRSTA